MSQTSSFLANARRRRPVVVVFSVAAVVASALAAASAFAQTSGGPEWPQFQGGPEHRGVSESAPAPPYRTRWTFTSPDGSGLSGAVIVDGLAISVGRESVYAVDVATGEVAWDVARADGPVSSPAVASGRRLTLLYVDGGASTTPSTSRTARCDGRASCPDASTSRSQRRTAAPSRSRATMTRVASSSPPTTPTTANACGRSRRS